MAPFLHTLYRLVYSDVFTQNLITKYTNRLPGFICSNYRIRTTGIDFHTNHGPIYDAGING